MEWRGVFRMPSKLFRFTSTFWPSLQTLLYMICETDILAENRETLCWRKLGARWLLR